MGILQPHELDVWYNLQELRLVLCEAAELERGGERVRILSQVVSVFAKNVKNRFMSEGINITLRHLAVQNDVKKVCSVQFYEGH